MLKVLLWVLLLSNAALFAYQRGGFDALLSTPPEPQSGREELHADKIRVIPPASVVPGAPSVPSAPNVPVPSAGPAAPAPSAVPATSAADVTPTVMSAACIEVGNFNTEEAKRFEAALAGSPVSGRLSRLPVQETVSHMVYIPPLPDREAAERKTGELRRLGVTDFYLIQDNSDLRWGISLGVFRTEEAARAHLAQLSQRGVRSARIGNRSIRASLVAFQVRDADPELRAAIERAQPAFPGAEIRECPPPRS